MKHSITPTLADESGLENQLLNECQAMTKYALTSGMKVPSTLVEKLATCTAQILKPYDASPHEDGHTPSFEPESPVALPTPQKRPGDNANALVKIHGQLTAIVAPATPRTILLLAEEAEKKSFWRFLGPVPLVRGLMVLAILSIAALVGTSLCEQVDGKVDWAHESGWHLLLEELFVLSAAAIGVSFYSLFQVNRYIAEGTYDPKYNASYSIRFVLGMVSGMILALLIPIDNDSALQEFSKPTLAMLGGFSVVVVYRLLKRLVDTVDSLVRGEPQDVAAAQEQTVRAHYAEQESHNRMKFTASLIKLQQQVSANSSLEDVQRELDRILETLIPINEEEPSSRLTTQDSPQPPDVSTAMPVLVERTPMTS